MTQTNSISEEKYQELVTLKNQLASIHMLDSLLNVACCVHQDNAQLVKKNVSKLLGLSEKHNHLLKKFEKNTNLELKDYVELLLVVFDIIQLTTIQVLPKLQPEGIATVIQTRIEQNNSITGVKKAENGVIDE